MAAAGRHRDGRARVAPRLRPAPDRAAPPGAPGRARAAARLLGGQRQPAARPLRLRADPRGAVATSSCSAGPRAVPTRAGAALPRRRSTSSRRSTCSRPSCATATRCSARASSPGCPSGPAARLFGGFLRPDALAVVRVRDRVIPLFIERDLGTERGDALPEKIRRYRSVATGRPELVLTVGFVVESERRARTIHELARAGRGLDAGPAVRHRDRRAAPARPDRRAVVRRPDAAARRASWRICRPSASLPILGPGCLSDGDALAALDDRGVTVLAPLDGGTAERDRPWR